MTAQPGSRLSGRRIVGQSLLLFGGYGLAQFIALLRNALLAHLLSKGDFGVAAALTITLQSFEMLSDPAVDRLIVRASNTEIDRLIATAHFATILRGVLLCAIMLVFAPGIAGLFGAHDAVSAFMCLAAVPLIRGLLHLDWRGAQRNLSNKPAVLVELVPQLAALALTYPAVQWSGSFEAILWIIIGQALAQLVMTHLLAEQSYRLAYDRVWMRRIGEFAWPAMISAVTLLAVYQVDRVLVGRFLGVEALAGYSVAFVLTMVPASLVGRAGGSLLLPIFAELIDKPEPLRVRLLLATELTVVVAACYLAAFVMLGGSVVEIVFGAKYAGLGHLTGMLATMWAVRMVQMPMTALILAAGEPRTLTVGGGIRASAALLAIAVALLGGDMVALAATGIVGEVLALCFHLRCVRRLEPAAYGAMLRRAAYVPAVAIVCWPLVDTNLWAGSSALTALAAAVVVAALGAGLLVRFQNLRRRVTSAIRSSGAVRDQTRLTAQAVEAERG